MLETMNQALSNLKLDAKCINFQTYRHFAFYDLELGSRCRISNIEENVRDLGLRLKAKSFPTMTLIPEKGIVRLETVSDDPNPVLFSQLKERAARPSGDFPLLLGESAEGMPVWTDMAKCPHMLIAGTTGSGKSTLLHAIIQSALNRKNTSIYLCDPKQIEFYDYSKNKMIKGVYTEIDDIYDLFNFLVEEMENRFDAIKNNRINISNKIFVVIDELADIMLQSKNKKFEKNLIRLAQKSRAAGIHMVLATQRPSVDILTGLIRANFPARIACKVSSRVDSQIILDKGGAENLIGRGDAIIKTQEYDYMRFQAAYASSL